MTSVPTVAVMVRGESETYGSLQAHWSASLAHERLWLKPQWKMPKEWHAGLSSDLHTQQLVTPGVLQELVR